MVFARFQRKALLLTLYILKRECQSGFMKACLEGTSNPQVGRSSRPGCAIYPKLNQLISKFVFVDCHGFLSVFVHFALKNGLNSLKHWHFAEQNPDEI